MSALGDLIKELNIAPESFAALTDSMSNPFAAMSKIQELGIPMEFFQKAMMIMMTNPNALQEFAQEMGASEDQLKSAQSMMDNMLHKNQ